jgi:hypothetical protein
MTRRKRNAIRVVAQNTNPEIFAQRFSFTRETRKCGIGSRGAAENNSVKSSRIVLRDFLRVSAAPREVMVSGVRIAEAQRSPSPVVSRQSLDFQTL